MLFKISQESGVSIDKMLMIGDSSSDVLMANNANCKSVWFVPIENEEIYDYKTLKRTIKSDYVAKDYGELEKIILG
jgi:phosphoglycolate phosphatase-like HAD superfamily hydrolase